MPAGGVEQTGRARTSHGRTVRAPLRCAASEIVAAKGVRMNNSGSGALSELLRAWRARLSPADVGFAPGRRRRVQGLRRSEVAMLAHISPDYLERLEQGRSTRPSPEVLDSLARALQLHRDERTLLFRAAGVAPPSQAMVPRYVSPGTTRLMQRLSDSPTAAFDAAWTLIAANPAWEALFGAGDRSGPYGDNVAWLQLTGRLEGLVEMPDDVRARFESAIVSDLLRASVTYPQDRKLAQFLEDLDAESAVYRQLCAEGRAVGHESHSKTIHHPSVGAIALDCDVVLMPDTEARLVIYTCAAGSEDASRLQLAITVGQQELSRST